MVWFRSVGRFGNTGGTGGSAGARLSPDVVKQGVGAKWSLDLQGSRERPAALCLREALEVGVQVGTSATRRASWVGKQGSIDRNDAQQC